TDAKTSAEGTAVQSTPTFDPTAADVVDATADTIDLGEGHGLQTGDKVKYKKDPAGTVIGGLTDNRDYFVRVSGDKVTLFDTQAHAKGTGSVGKINLTGPGTGTEHSLAAPGAGGTGIGVAISVNVADVDNKAQIGDATITAESVTVQALVPDVDGDDTHSFGAAAVSGASGADTGVAGSLAINIGLSNAQATIADNATLTVGGGDVALTAQNRVENKVSAKASAGDNGSLGVG